MHRVCEGFQVLSSHGRITFSTIEESQMAVCIHAHKLTTDLQYFIMSLPAPQSRMFYDRDNIGIAYFSLIYFIYFVVVGIKPSTLYFLGKCSTLALYHTHSFS